MSVGSFLQRLLPPVAIVRLHSSPVKHHTTSNWNNWSDHALGNNMSFQIFSFLFLALHEQYLLPASGALHLFLLPVYVSSWLSVLWCQNTFGTLVGCRECCKKLWELHISCVLYTEDQQGKGTSPVLRGMREGLRTSLCTVWWGVRALLRKKVLIERADAGLFLS